MARIIDPPRSSFEQLPTLLTYGERKVIDLFDQRLPAEWEIYVQPHLNGLRPDIVLLHPAIGVAVFEIKDWNLQAMSYYAEESREGHPILMARDKNGKSFSHEVANPVNKILLYEKELFDLYCPRLNNRAGRAVITAGLVFPCSPCCEVKRVFGPFQTKEMKKYSQYYPMTGAEEVSSNNIEEIFPEVTRTSSKYMNDDIAKDLRGWLKEPFFSQEQRIGLDKVQHEFATTRTDTGYRRIKGPAGCGKSVVLAARASELAAEGEHVLVVSYNITLLNYLRDLTVRHVAPRQVIRQQIDFLNFHTWCKRICYVAGHAKKYNELWSRPSDSDDLVSELNEQVLNEHMPNLIQEIYRENSTELSCPPKYDAILVDEGQDFQLSWWAALRCALREGGEMVLVADKTQNLYGTAANWTEDAMKDAGFHGPWAEMKISYRLPSDVVEHVRQFAKKFLISEEVDVPVARQREIDFSPTNLRWVHVRNQSKVLNVCDSEFRRMMKWLRHDTAVADITFLFSDNKTGQEFIKKQQNGKGKKSEVLHTFGVGEFGSSRRQKLAFFQGDARTKATTVHSFKGWEARHLLVCISSVKQAKERSLLYTALTRLRWNDHGSCLTVVSCCGDDELREYASSWPDYEEV